MQKLYDEPNIAVHNMCRGYDGMRHEDLATLPEDAKTKLDAWLAGRTGFPFVDACMRSLQDSGWINFRMRCMLVSFASYDLWLSWKHIGPPLARLFIDYEPGIHYPQLQMQSGTTGINSNRIYDVDKQRSDHDPLGEFTRKHVPELADVTIGKTLKLKRPANYPPPIVVGCEAVKAARAQLKEYNHRVKHETSEGKDVFQKHGSRRPNAGDLQRMVRGAVASTQDDSAGKEPTNQRGVLVELARSSRSQCRCCKQAIEKDGARCGLEVRVRGRWEVRWCHARCFLSSCTDLARFQGNRKATCRSSAKAISKGDLFVRFSVGDGARTGSRKQLLPCC